MEEGLIGVAEKSAAMDMPRRATLKDRLEENKKRLSEKLANVTAALEFLERNPNFAEFHDIIGKAGF